MLTDLLRDSAGLPEGLSANPEIAGLTADSREVEPGYLFAALCGSTANGADFVAEAIERGAVAILGDDELELAPQAGAVLVRAANPRRCLALLAARLYPRQPANIAAVTGTNGKTSVVYFARQIWQELGYRSGTIGTLGAQWRGHVQALPTTTPEPVSLHRLLDLFVEDDVDCAAIEASSHGLDQHRLDGTRIGSAGFTNLTHDHLDYHASFEAYLAAKQRLFSELLVDGGTAVLNADVPEFDALRDLCGTRKHKILSYGVSGEDIRIERHEQAGGAQQLKIAVGGNRYDIELSLVGDFQALNALCALGLVIASGGDEAASVAALERLSVVPGRLERVAVHGPGANVYVDYAHTPDALARALRALRPAIAGKLVVVFGAGGDRDRGKRFAMGAAAAQHADRVIVTDDNPRSEDPATIRQAIMAACPKAIEIGDREAAIRTALGLLGEQDGLLIAG
ncbi:MAG: UDP-N-acetylmuramoyl-L-alanyl-D-glutamate--2,6-diaminopimelate ligase, partial [Proteobacteria bacterium]|nr:UDP-N-acetylmuramoyl-L-alanyl-D-glutamate--2,6-diaminopimelate ligase [Pseudomonadota bacterium]